MKESVLFEGMVFRYISKLFKSCQPLRKLFLVKIQGNFHLHVCVETVPLQYFSADRLQVTMI